MEPITIFAAMVGLIGAIHLFSSATQRFGNGIYDQGNKQEKREDWYCFFQPLDLLGEEWDETDDNKPQQPAIGDNEHLEQRRRQQANRPRLQA